MSSLTSFSHSDSFLRTKISLLTFYRNRYPDWSEKILVLLEYLQLLSQSILIYPNAVDQTSPHNSDFTKGVIYFFKLVNPASLLPFRSDDPITYIILLVVLGSMLLKYLLAGYVTYKAYRNHHENNWLLNLWRWIFRRQGRILYFFITSFWIYLILNCSSGTFTISGMGKAAIITISSGLIGIEYIFSAILELGFSYLLPTKNFLASKSYRTVMITLNQKVVIQIAQLIFQQYFRAGLWIFIALNFTLNLTRAYHYYTAFPLYNFKALVFQGALLSIVASMNIACLFQNILQESDYQGENVNFIVLVWILISILACKLSRDYLVGLTTNLLIRPSKASVKKLLHRAFTMKQIKKWLKLPYRKSEENDIRYLLSSTESFNYQNLFNQPLSKSTHDLLSNGNDNEIYLHYFEYLSTKFPHDFFIKLFIAKLCSKDAKLYPKAINIITKLAQNKWSKYFLSASLLEFEVEKRILKSYSSHETTLDILAYIKNQINVDKLRDNMLKQTELTITICNNVLGEKSDFGLIFNNAQIIDKYRLQVQKQINRLHKTIPSCFIEPHLICAGYHLVLNDSLDTYMKYNDLYLQKQSKYHDVFQETKLNEENLYQEDNAFLILSGEKRNKGQIVYSSQSIENICGGKQISYNQAHISTLFTPSFQSLYAEAFRQIFETGKEISLNEGKEVFLQHKDGYIIHSELYVMIHPYLTQGLYLDMIIRPIPSLKEYFIIKEDGTIEGATKGIADDLRIKNFFNSRSKLLNIKLLSEELWLANQAFNTIEISSERGDSLHKTKTTHSLDSLDPKKALTLYKVFSETKRVQLKAISKAHLESFNKEESELYSYDYHISMIQFGPSLAKLFTFEKIHIEKEQDNQESQSEDIRRRKEKYPTIKFTVDQGNKMGESVSIDLTEPENIDCPERYDDEELGHIERPETYITTHGNLLSPTTRTSRPLLSSSRGDKFIGSLIVEPNHKLPIAIPEKEIPKMPEGDLNPLSSNRLRSSSQNRTANMTFRTAIAFNFRPKSFTCACLMFYGVILITFLSQVILKIVSDQIMTTLTIKTNLLTASQLRAYRIYLIATNARVGVTRLTATAEINYGLVLDLPGTVESMKNQTDFIEDYNNQILNYASSLDLEAQHQLFSNDIKVYDYDIKNLNNSPSRYITQFQTIDEAIGNIYRLKALSNKTSEEAFLLFYSLRYNIVNDFLYKCEQITIFLTETVHNERTYLELIITLCLLIVPLLLLGIILMATFIIWRQYLIEKKNMLAFVKLNPETVKDIQTNLKIFKKNLQNKDYSEYQKPIEVNNESLVMPIDETPKRNGRKRDDRVIDYSQMRKRYYGYFIKVTCYVIVLIGIMVGNFVSAEKANQDIYRKQNQIHFANRISEVAGTIHISMEDAFQTKNSATIKHTNNSLKLMIDELEELKNMQSQIPDVFLDEDRTYDPQVKSQLYENYCSQFTFTSSVYSTYCNMTLAAGQRVNLLSLLAYYQDLMQEKLQDYYSCDKSTFNSLYQCAYKNINNFMPAWVLLIGESFSLGLTISNNLGQSIANANYQRNIFLIVFSVSLVVASLLIWLQILAKLKEGYNDFKKVLQLFPPVLILSSFQLKTFLLQHSNQIKA